MCPCLVFLPPPCVSLAADAFGADEEDTYSERFGTQFAERILELGRVTKVLSSTSSCGQGGLGNSGSPSLLLGDLYWPGRGVSLLHNGRCTLQLQSSCGQYKCFTRPSFMQ